MVNFPTYCFIMVKFWKVIIKSWIFSVLVELTLATPSDRLKIIESVDDDSRSLQFYGILLCRIFAKRYVHSIFLAQIFQNGTCFAKFINQKLFVEKITICNGQ